MQANTAVIDSGLGGGALRGVDTSASGAAWAAIFAGAAAAAALSLALFVLGFGLGMSVISPWSGEGIDASSAAISSVVWVFVTQILASALGGYLAGRLRVKWPDVHNDEVFFRDTAHGFLTWAVASLGTAILFGATTMATVDRGVQAGAAVASKAGDAVAQIAGAGAAGAGAAVASDKSANAGGGAEGGGNNPLSYFADSLFRGEGAQAGQPAAPGDKGAATAEALRILAFAARSGDLSAEDRQRLGQLVAQQTGLNQADAEKRVTDVYYRFTTTVANAKAATKDAADKARKAAAHTSLWFFVALLCGAFSASYAATLGGKQRDNF
jgi:hypothetical protein